MRSVKLNLLFTLCLFCLVASSQQGTVKLNLAYKAAMPLGNFKNIADKVSFNGWEAGLMYGITDQISLGVQTGFQDFYKKYDREVLHEPGSDLSAVITNSVQLMPLLVKGSYAFSENNVVRPYVALGVGGNLVQYRKYYGQFADSRSKLSFMAQPELGITMPVGPYKRTGLFLAASYNYIPFMYNDANGFSHAAIKAGVTIPLR